MASIFYWSLHCEHAVHTTNLQTKNLDVIHLQGDGWTHPHTATVGGVAFSLTRVSWRRSHLCVDNSSGIVLCATMSSLLSLK